MSQSVFCYCKQPYKEGETMAECQNGKDCGNGRWFHPRCVGLSAQQLEKINPWFCKHCADTLTRHRMMQEQLKQQQYQQYQQQLQFRQRQAQQMQMKQMQQMQQMQQIQMQQMQQMQGRQQVQYMSNNMSNNSMNRLNPIASLNFGSSSQSNQFDMIQNNCDNNNNNNNINHNNNNNSHNKNGNENYDNNNMNGMIYSNNNNNNGFNGNNNNNNDNNKSNNGSASNSVSSITNSSVFSNGSMFSGNSNLTSAASSSSNLNMINMSNINANFGHLNVYSRSNSIGNKNNNSLTGSPHNINKQLPPLPMTEKEETQLRMSVSPTKTLPPLPMLSTQTDNHNNGNFLEKRKTEKGVIELDSESEHNGENGSSSEKSDSDVNDERKVKLTRAQTHSYRRHLHKRMKQKLRKSKSKSIEIENTENRENRKQESERENENDDNNDNDNDNDNENDNHSNNSNDNETSNARATEYDDNGMRRSTRIKNKRKFNEMWGISNPFYGSPKKKKAKPSIPKSKTTTVVTQRKQDPIKKENARIRILAQELEKRRYQWIEANFSAFEPFLTKKVCQKLELNSKKCSKVKIDQIAPKKQPKVLTGELRDYQLESLNWLRNLRYYGVPAIIGDEMGLGKTIQSIAAMASLFEETKERGPHLVICPLSVTEAWLEECKKWLPQLRVVLFHGTAQHCKSMIKNELLFDKFDICITTYEIAVTYGGHLRKFFWQYFIIDEAHKIKNEQTNWHKTLKLVRCLYKVLLTGTPIQNDMHELWALLSFMLPQLFEDSEVFDAIYQSSTMNQDKELLAKAPKLLKPLMIRRLKSDVELTLPPKEEIILKVPMTRQQCNWYKMYLAAYANLIDTATEYSKENKDITERNMNKTFKEWKKIRHLYMQLRKIAIHPYLLPNLSEKLELAHFGLIDQSGKLKILDKLLNRLIAEKHRILIFSCFTMVLDLLGVYCDYRKYRYLRLDGNTSRQRRKIDISRFNAKNSPFSIYLISNRAGGLGINLQSADTVVHFDSDWNPQADLQAQARAHRIGQTKLVKIYRLISQDTVEERILFRSQQKLYLDAIVNEGGKIMNDRNLDELDLSDKDLISNIKFGASKIFESKDEDFDDIKKHDLDALLQRSIVHRHDTNNTSNDNNNDNSNDKSEKTNDNSNDNSNDKGKQIVTESQSELLKQLDTNNVADFNFKMELVSAKIFQGVSYEDKQERQEMIDIAREDDGSKHYRSRHQHHDSTMTKSGRIVNKMTHSVVVNGLKLDVEKERHPNTTFYEQSAENIFDKRQIKQWRHQFTHCWTCDKCIPECDYNSITGNNNDNENYVCCTYCPKVFHNTRHCWRGEQGKVGGPVCEQHHCCKCNKTPAQCGLLLRCLGCTSGFCVDCAPRPKYACHIGTNDDNDDSDNDNDGNDGGSGDNSGLHWVDRCLVMEHYGYTLPHNAYMYIFCCDTCKQYYETDYSKRVLPDLSLNYRLLPKSLRRTLKSKLEAIKRDESNAILHYNIGNMVVDERVQQYFVSNTVGGRLKEMLDGDSELIIEFYKLLFDTQTEDEFSIDDGMHNMSNTTNEKKEKKEENSNENENENENENSKEKEKSKNNNSNNEKDEKPHLIDGYRVKLDLTYEQRCDRRFGAICKWKGIELKRDGGNTKTIVSIYQRLMDELMTWKPESLKTLCDIMGFFSVTRKRSKIAGETKIEEVALTHPKKKICQLLTTFFICVTPDTLVTKTSFWHEKAIDNDGD